jgi:hypothetical protein
MNSKEKYIGLNQRIPFDVLDAAIQHYFLHGIIDRDLILKHVLEFTAGANRAAKAKNLLAKILKTQSKFIDLLKNSLKEATYIDLKIDNRKAFCLCLISLTYPITYDLLVPLAQGFKVQKQLNKKFISEKLMSIYGSNRVVNLSIDALLPMVIELNAIKRDKISLYSCGSKLSIGNRFIAELIIFTDVTLSGSKSILVDDLHFKPWYSYFDIPSQMLDNFNFLISKKDSAVGKGYLTIKV